MLKKIKHQKIISHLTSLEQKARQLRKEADGLGLIPRGRVLGYIKTVELSEVGLAISQPLIVEMPEEEKSKMVRSYKSCLTLLANSLRLRIAGLKKHPQLWDGEFRSQIKEMIFFMEEFEKEKIILFQEKDSIKS